MVVEVSRILQIGDVHYPDWPTLHEGRDLGQAVHSTEMIGQLGYLRMERILRALNQTIEQENPQAVCLVGDLTTRGNQDALDLAAVHLAALLRPSYGATSAPHILAVPGNHDISKALASEAGLVGKFAVLGRIAAANRWVPPPIDLPSIVDLNNSSHTARIYGINTCLGSWELSSLGSSVLSALEQLQRRIDEDVLGRPSTAKKKSRVNFEDLHYDNYDAPFVHGATLSALSDGIQKLSPHSIAIVVGHHNILSQEVVRYAPFADLINGGALRRSLQQPGRPVVYLHGHIHTDPIEIIQQVERPESQIVSVSAPTLMDGFNLIECYAAVGKRPLGMCLRRYRIEKNGNVVERPVLRVPFYASPAQRRLSARTHQLLQFLEHERVIEFTKLIDHAEVVKIGLSESAAESELLQLYWSGMIEIDNLAFGPSNWHIIAGLR